MRLLLPLLTLAGMAAAQIPASITGVPTVTDGDTLQIRGVKIRLHGVDAPESSQTCLRGGQAYGCGREAAFALADLMKGKNVTCLRRDTDRYGRMVGVCTVNGTEVNRWLVEQGWALPYVQYGGAVYQEAERGAKPTFRGRPIKYWPPPEQVPAVHEFCSVDVLAVGRFAGRFIRIPIKSVPFTD